jgi:hypothetical protein
MLDCLVQPFARRFSDDPSLTRGRPKSILAGISPDQVLSCRSFCGVFSQDLATLAENGENRMLMSPFTNALFQPRGGSNGERSLSRLDHGYLTLAFCLATRRCMNLGPSFL